MLELEKMDEIEAAFDTEEKQQEEHTKNEAENDEDTIESTHNDSAETDNRAGPNVHEEPDGQFNRTEEASDIISGDAVCDDAVEDSETPSQDKHTEIERLNDVEVEDISEIQPGAVENNFALPEVEMPNAEEPALEEVDKPADTWDCSQCTFVNKMSRKTCEMCKFKGNPKRRKK